MPAVSWCRRIPSTRRIHLMRHRLPRRMWKQKGDVAVKTIKTKAMIALAMAAFGTTASRADVIFDSKALAEAAGAPVYNDVDRLFHDGLGAVFSVGADTAINQIGMFVHVPAAQDIKFLIFKTGLGGGAADLLFSQTKHFDATDAMQFIYSDPFDFVLQKDVIYDIGIMGNGADIVFRFTVDRTWTQNSLSTNWLSHIALYDTPVSGSYVQAEPFIQLKTAPVAAAPGVPEPASWALMMGGFACAGGALRARKARHAIA